MLGSVYDSISARSTGERKKRVNNPIKLIRSLVKNAINIIWIRAGLFSLSQWAVDLDTC